MSDRERILSVMLALVIAWSVPGVHAATPVRTRLISQSSGGVQGDAESYLPSVSGDGRFVAFESGSTNLIAHDTNDSTDIFVRDRETNETTRVSVNSAGEQSDDGSYNAVITSDGRYVAFISDASNLVAKDSNGYSDVFVRDRVTRTTRRVSVNAQGFQGNLNSYDPSISDDGRFVAFWSPSSNLVLNDTNVVSDVFVRDRQEGKTTRVSLSSDGTQADGGSFDPSISADGRFVAFDSGATNLVENDTNAVADIFVRDRKETTTRRPSVDSAGVEGNGVSAYPSISDNGRFVAFVSAATNLVGNDTNAVADIFVRDRKKRTTRMVSVSSGGAQGNGNSYDPSISASGRFVAFSSSASTLVGNDTNDQLDVFVRDRGERTTKRVSVSSAGVQANGRCIGPSISDDGRVVAFYSEATNLVRSDTNNNDDIFVRGPT